MNGSDWIEGRLEVLRKILLDAGIRCGGKMTLYSLVVAAAKEIQGLRSELQRLKSSKTT